MKTICLSVVVVAACLAVCYAEAPSAPYPPSGWKPSGRLLLLPVKQQQLDNQYGPPAPVSATYAPPQAEETVNASSFPASEQLQQQPGVTSGVYHVLLPDGRLQRVEFTTAPLNSEAAQSFTSPSQHQESNGQYQPQQQSSNYQIQQSQNFEAAPVQQFAFPAAFPQTNDQSSRFTQGQTAGQSAFQKPAFQQNQFGLNTFQQSQTQQNHLGQTSFQQKPFGKYEDQTSQQDSFSTGDVSSKQERQYLSPRPNSTPESENNFNQYNTFQSNAVISSGKIVNAQQQQNNQPQVFGYQPAYSTQTQQSEQADAETVPTPQTGFVANVQYKDVEPIPGPIYSYNPAPLVRILRKTE
ncbi:nuclear transcription factor Y subunit beta [Nilaparvata lugens]|uniref:nuclear transcription factor Y subunit beta n=1 Tax=Nilaparvata lugens TaxID=108931 RepID=UPI00193CC125|nr:nuclear transcription factor Y subunit beta [Nilaparvata lugens]